MASFMKATGYVIAVAIVSALSVCVDARTVESLQFNKFVRVCSSRDVALVESLACTQRFRRDVTSTTQDSEDNLHAIEDLRVLSSQPSNARLVDEVSIRWLDENRHEESLNELEEHPFESKFQESPSTQNLSGRRRREVSWDQEFESFAEMRKYCCHHRCPIEYFVGLCR